MADRTGLYYPTREELDEILAERDERYNYSTSEKAVGKWIDGATIYRKTVYFGSLPDSTSKNVAHGITDLDKVIKVDAMANAGARWFPLPSAYPADNNSAIRVAIEGDNIQIVTGNARSSMTAYVTIYYTTAALTAPKITVTTAGVAGTRDMEATVDFGDYSSITQIRSSAAGILPTALWTVSDTTLTIATGAYSPAQPFVATFEATNGRTTTLQFNPYTAGEYS